ncbi:unnamed protein product [Symbiodinium sp. CCMP2592]|nr:unnamed protein product [Symbiodinium sp. CCMP2592]
MELTLRPEGEGPLVPIEPFDPWPLVVACVVWTLCTFPPAALWTAPRLVMWGLRWAVRLSQEELRKKVKNSSKSAEGEAKAHKQLETSEIEDSSALLCIRLHEGGPCMATGTPQKFTYGNPDKTRSTTGLGPSLGPRMGYMSGSASLTRSGNADAGAETAVTGSGVWAHFGPSIQPPLATHGTNGGHRQQPAFEDLALRRLKEDTKNKQLLGRSPALFGGAPVFGGPIKATRRQAENQPVEDHLPQKLNHGAKFKKALDIARNELDLERAVDDLKGKFYADSNKAPQARKEADVLELAATLCKGRPAFPATPTLVVKFAAALRAAGYKSGAQYLSALRVAHSEMDFPITPALKRSFDLAKRALGRDVEPADRAPEFQIADFPEDADAFNLQPGEVAFPKHTYALALTFMLRRCELERLKWEDIVLDQLETMVTLHIRKSKTDQGGKGVKRTLGCTCRTSPATCPVELVKSFARDFDRALPGLRKGATWITCSPEGTRITDNKLVNSWTRAAGRTVRGHSARRSGTMFYVRAGLGIAEVTYLGRWHSDLVFQYGPGREGGWGVGDFGFYAEVGENLGTLESGPPVGETPELFFFYLDDQVSKLPSEHREDPRQAIGSGDCGKSYDDGPSSRAALHDFSQPTHPGVETAENLMTTERFDSKANAPAKEEDRTPCIALQCLKQWKGGFTANVDTEVFHWLSARECEKGTELLDSCCACRGSVRFICTECLLLQWEARPDKGLQCGVCRQAFSGRAAALLTERLQKHVEQQQDVQTGPSVDLLKQQVTTATGLWQQGKLQEAANLFRETISGLKMTDAKGQLYSAQHNLSLVMVAMGHPEEARAELRIARRGLATLYGAQHPLALKAAHNEAMAANAAGHREEALKLYEVALEARCRVLGSHHVDRLGI